MHIYNFTERVSVSYLQPQQKIPMCTQGAMWVISMTHLTHLSKSFCIPLLHYTFGARMATGWTAELLGFSFQ
jgi:hypothetical protein